MTRRPVTRDEIVRVARAWLGTPYHHQAAVKGAGCDCLGLIRGVYAELYGAPPVEEVPPYTPDWAESSGRETLLHAARRHLQELPGAVGGKRGDVLVFRLHKTARAKHAGILTGDARMVHAQEKVGCVEVSLNRWWARRVAGVFHFPGVA